MENKKGIGMNKYILDEKSYIDLKSDSLIVKYSLKNEKLYIHDDKEIEVKKLYKYLKSVSYKYNNIIFLMDFSHRELSLKEADMIVLSIKKLQNIKKLKNIPKYVLVVSGKSYYERFVTTSICVLNSKSKEEKYNFLYDSICDYLDDRVVKTNACGFKNDKCIAKKDTNCTMGCCHYYKNKYLGFLYEKELHLCEYQQNKRCTAKCITCKMYMCDTLKKKGYHFNTNNIIIIKRYFNILQKLVIISSFFTPKEKIIKKIMLLDFRI